MPLKLTKSAVDSLEAKDKPYDVFDSQIKGFLVRTHPSSKKVFYYSYRNSARKRNRVMIGALGSSITVQQARDKALDYASQVSQGHDVQKEKSKARQDAVEMQDRTLGRFLDDHYEHWVITNQKSGQETVRCIRSYFKHLLSTPLPDISHVLIDKWRTQKLKDGLQPSTINRRVTLLRGLLSRAVEWEVIHEHPFKKLKDLKIDKRPKVRYLSDDENRRLIDVLQERDEEIKQARERGNQHRQERGYELLPSLLDWRYGDRMTPMVLLSLKTGMRKGEVFDLRWQDINYDTQQVTVMGTISKSSNTRHIPLNSTAIDTLKTWQKQAPATEPNDRVFPADKGGRLDNVKKSWLGILERAKISSFRWHDMRHDFASQLVMKGVPLNTVRELCGHASMDTTLRYAHLAPDHKQDAVDLLG